MLFVIVIVVLLFVVMLLLVLRECSSLAPISWLLGKKMYMPSAH
jgi:hypothetical protein